MTTTSIIAIGNIFIVFSVVIVIWIYIILIVVRITNAGNVS